MSRRAEYVACSCGNIRTYRAATCRACYVAAELVKQIANAKEFVWRAEDVPAECACLNVGLPSEWHCACKRWKPKDSELCEICELAEVYAIPT